MNLLDNDISRDDLDLIMANCITDLRVTCKVLFPGIFTAPFSTLHDAIFTLINAGHKKIAIAAPRGIGKTSIARTIANRAILFELCNFIVYVSNSATSAEMQTENMKRDLLSNRLVRNMFGNIKDQITEYTGGMDESFSKTAWTAFGRTFILPRGSGQQIRGLNWNNHRPELVIIDDLEDKEEIKNEQIRLKMKDWFDADLMKTEDKYGDGCVFIYIDTIKHEDAILVDLMESPEWASIQLSICDENYKSYDTNYMTDAEILTEVEEHRRKGNLDVFYMERMNIPVAKEDAVFKSEYFKYFEDLGDELEVMGVDGKPEKVRANDLLHVTICDPAKTVKVQSAETAILTIAVHRRSKRIFFRDITHKRLYPDEIYDEMFRQVRLFRSFILGYEVTGLNEFVSQPVLNECRVRSLFPILVDLKAKGKKEERVASMAPYYRLGYMYHNKANCGPLEQQLLSFPRSKLWDVMDAACYIIKIMDEHAIYFDPEGLSDTPSEDEYDELEIDNEKALPIGTGAIV